MANKSKVWAATLLLLALSADQALAGFVRYTPPAAVPELDGPGGISAIALLVSVVAVLFNRSKTR